MIPAELPTSDELVQAALDYARQGLPVFPCYTPINGVCDCWKGPDCEDTGKHPRTKNGLTDATTDEMTIRRWWKQWSIANIAIALPEGYVAVDVDGDHGRKRLEDDGKRLPTTAVQSSGGGSHYVYRTREHIGPRTLIEASSKGAHDGIDLRGPGGYIMASPSVHKSGRVYEWAVPLSQIEVAPDWLETVGKQPTASRLSGRTPVDFNVVLAGLPEGSRKRELYRAACKLRGADVPIEWAISLALESAARCSPPLEAKQAERKVREAYAKFPPNAVAGEQEVGVTLLGLDSVMIEFETCRFVFSEMEKAGRELRAEMEVTSLLPGSPPEPYVQSLNLLSVSSRDQCRREIEHVLGKGPEHQWVKLISRAVTKAKDAYLNVDRSISTADMTAPEVLEFIIPDICVVDGINILFGNGSAGKTWLLMWAAICVARGIPFLGRPTKRLNVLYADCETGQSTYAYRMRRLCAGAGLTLEDVRNVRFWNGKGLPLADQVAGIRRTCDEHEIGLICLDHLAAACGGDANEQSVASALANAVGKIGLPVLALAHVTGADIRNPEAVEKPFGSIFWHNNARRTTFVLRQQEAESSIAELGLYPKKVNDGRWPAPYAARIVFEDPSGPITMDAGDLRANSVLSAVRGEEHVIWDLLAAPMLAEAIAAAVGKSERHVKDVMKAHPRMFVEIQAGGRGVKSTWARVEARMPYADPDDEPPEDFDFGESDVPF